MPVRERLMPIGQVKVGEWVQYPDWQTWRQVEGIRTNTFHLIVFKLAGYPVECSCSPDVEYPWSAERPVQ